MKVRSSVKSICDKCKEDNGAFMRVTDSFIHWVDPPPSDEEQESIYRKVLGSSPTH